jgi:predicted helicase
MRGVYYTPEPVVDYIVRSVDLILKRDFKLGSGLADASQVKFKKKRAGAKGSKIVEESFDAHRVQILDPACGTGTFLHAIVDNIRERFLGNAGMWPSYVAEHLLPRIYGFELLMAPYAVAHMKLGLQLKDSGYDFRSEERLRVYLTNTLEEAHEMSGLPLFTQWLADEAAAAGDVKKNVPIMVVVGNPPYSGHSANKGAWIAHLVEEYKKSPELKKPAQAKWLSDDYVKFIRFSQWRIEQTGYGILAFVTNHSYLDNPTFLDMRASLMASFDDLYVLDLHGNSKKKERAPNGGKDENVFDIQQGVAIALFVRRTTRAKNTTVHRADLWGSRAEKYAWLAMHDVSSTPWKDATPDRAPWLFLKQDNDLLVKYQKGWSVVDIFLPNGDPAPGVVTTHDDFAISWTKQEAIKKVEQLLETKTEAEARQVFTLCSQSQWNYDRAKQELADGKWKKQAVPIYYRPFDIRWTIWNSNVAVHRRERANKHMLKENIALLIPKQTKNDWGCLVTDSVAAHKAASVYDPTSIIPLWIYNDSKNDLFGKSHGGRQPNLSPEFLKFIAGQFGKGVVSPEEIFAYVYAILYSPSYRQQYADFIRREFPRITFVNDVITFKKIANLGEKLIELHLMKKSLPFVTSYPNSGNNRVDKFEFKLNEQREDQGHVHINGEQYFSKMPSTVWKYTIGGYQVAQKWLKDRKGRMLTFDDLQHYGKIIAVINETISVQGEIDKAFGSRAR